MTDASEEMGRRAAFEYERKAARQSSYYDFIHETAKDNPNEAARLLCTGLMRGNSDDLQLGYSIGAALISTIEALERWGFPLSTSQIGLLVDRIAVPKEGLVDYGPTTIRD